MNKNNIILIIFVFLSAIAGTVLAVLIMNAAGYVEVQKEDPVKPVTEQSEPAPSDSGTDTGTEVLQPGDAASGDMFDGLPEPLYTGKEADKLNNEILLKYKKILFSLDEAVKENIPEGAVDSVRSECHAQVYDYDGDGLFEMVVTFTANGKDIFAGLYRYTDVDKYGAEDIVRVTQRLGDMSKNLSTAGIRIGKSGDSLFLHCVFTWDNEGTECGTDHIYCIDRENIYHIASLDWIGGTTPIYLKDGAECSAETFNALFSIQNYRVCSYSSDSPGFNLQEVFPE